MPKLPQALKELIYYCSYILLFDFYKVAIIYLYIFLEKNKQIIIHNKIFVLFLTISGIHRFEQIKS